jgi:hypothetical protein
MLSDRHLHFLHEKIQDIRSALFYSLSNSVLKIPTSIVTALKVDEEGQVWFFVSRPRQQLTEFDRQFPARMEFYKKGKHSVVKINGRACIVNDANAVTGLVTLPDDIKEKALDQLLLIKVKIEKAEYFETSPDIKGNTIKQVASQFKKWLLGEPAGIRPYQFEPGY